MNAPRQKTWTDEEMLEVLYLREHCRWTVQAIANHFGVGRNSINGILNRVNIAADKHSDNQDGTMDPLWWRR